MYVCMYNYTVYKYLIDTSTGSLTSPFLGVRENHETPNVSRSGRSGRRCQTSIDLILRLFSQLPLVRYVVFRLNGSRRPSRQLARFFRPYTEHPQEMLTRRPLGHEDIGSDILVHIEKLKLNIFHNIKYHGFPENNV